MRKLLLSWKDIHKFYTNSFVEKSTIILIVIPILEKLFSKLNPDLELLIFDTTINLVFELPFNLKVLYCLAALLAVTRWIYLWRCPPMIKEYDTYEEWTKDGKIQKHLDKCSQKYNLKLVTNLNLQEYFWEVYEKLDVHNMILRIIISILFYTSILLFLYLFFEQTKAVLNLF